MGSGPQKSDLADTPSWNPQTPVAGQAPQMGNTQPIQYSGAFGQPSNNFAGGGMGKGPQQMGQQGQYDAWGRPGGAPAASTPPQAVAPMAPQPVMQQPVMQQPGMMGHQGQGAFNNPQMTSWQDPMAKGARMWDMGDGAAMLNPFYQPGGR